MSRSDDSDRSETDADADKGVSEEAITEARRDAPDWEDDYLDRVADRLVFNYDLEQDFTARGERFDLYGLMTIESQKHFLHPALSYANHGSTEHLFCRRASRITVADCKRLLELGHELAEEYVDADEEHYSTDFTFVCLVPEIPEEVEKFVAGFRDRTLLKYGFYGHYEINLLVVAPDREELVASQEAHLQEAFRLWEPIEREEPGLLDLIARRLQI